MSKLSVLASFSIVALACVAGATATAGFSDPLRIGYLTGSGAQAPERTSLCTSGPCDALVSFIENGFPDGTTWSITTNGTTRSETSETITLVLGSGIYTDLAGNVSGYSASPPAGSVTVEPAAVAVTINFSSTPLPAAAPLFGLPPDAAYLVLGTTVGVVMAALALFVWRSRRPPN